MAKANFGVFFWFYYFLFFLGGGCALYLAIKSDNFPVMFAHRLSTNLPKSISP